MRKKANTDKKVPNYKEILEASPDLYLVLNPQFNIVDATEAFLKATMVIRKNIIGKYLFDVFPDNPNDPNSTGINNVKSSLERVLKFKTADTMAVQKYDIRRPANQGGGFEERYWSPVNIPILTKSNEVKYILHRVEDVTEFVQLKSKQKQTNEKLKSHIGAMEIEIYKRAQEIQNANKKLENANDELQHMAYYDTLTNLPNRKLLIKILKKALSIAKNSSWKVALLFIDLDQFKLINDTLGHEMGDTLLKIISKRLTHDLHTGDIASRLGGDEFVVILDKIQSSGDITHIAERILSKIKEPIVIDTHTFFISASIGISIYPDNGKDETSLLKHADIAMYNAKETGRDIYQFCTNEMIENIRKKLELETYVRLALKNNALVLNYQPQFDLTTGKIYSVEALVRIQKEDGSLMLPGEFLSLCEETGLIAPIGEWVFSTACKEYKNWERNNLTKQNHTHTKLKLAVNFSARQLKEPDFLKMIQDTMQKTHFLPENLEFEITENPIITDIERSEKILRELKDMGIKIVIDDFGIGYSSLNYLRQFEIDALKIDPCLIKNVPNEKTDSQIIISIIHMAHAMDILVVCEGAETKEQIQFLMKENCDRIQSNYFSKPLNLNEITNLLKEKKDSKLIILP